MNKKILFTLLLLLLPLSIGCDSSSDNFSGTTIINNSNSGPGLSGQTGQVTLQTQLARASQVLAQETFVFQTQTIPSFVTDLRFTGVDANGAFVYGPVVKSKAQTIVLEDVPVEVVSLRIELLTDGFTVGGLVTPIDVISEETTFITDPTYVFPGGSDSSEVYGNFILRIDEGEPSKILAPEGDFPAASAPVFDFPTSLVTNGVTRVSPGNYTVSEAGDYLVSYGVEMPTESQTLVQLVRNNSYVPNTQVDLSTVSFFFPDQVPLAQSFEAPLQAFQYLVTLQAGDEVSLRVVDFGFAGPQNRINAQTEGNPVFYMVQGTFSITRLGEGGVTGPTVPVNAE